MAEPMVKIYSHSQFDQLLAMFHSAVDCGEYTEKIPYDTWRKLKKMSGDVKVEYCSPFVKISYLAYTSCGEEVETVVFSAKTYNNGFGRFFYDYVVKEKHKMTNSEAIASLKACDAAMSAATAALATNCAKATDVTALEWKADYMQASDINSILADKIYTYDSDSTAGVANYGTSITDTVKIAGKPLQTNTIELNIPSLDHLGYHQYDGTWDSVASKNDMEDRFNKLEAELQKKVDKAEMKKENDTMMKGINFDFGPCGNTVRLSMYGMAIQNISGEWVSYNPDSREIINVDVFNMADGGKYMYKMPVAIADVKEGDIVIHNRVPMFVTAINENGTFEVTDVRAGETKNIIPTRNMFGFNFMTKVVSMFGAFANAPTADQPFGNMLPFLMLNGENGKDIDPMMFMFMMNQGGNNGMNPMMWYFMFKDNKDIDPAVMWMITSMAAGATPAFMTGNYPKATITSDVQATPNFMAGNSPNTAFTSDVQK